MNAKGLIILLIVITALTGIVLYWNNLQISREVPAFNIVHREKPQGLGATIYETGSNPVTDSVPESNALSGAVTNPFDTYKNPFDTE